MRAFNFSAGPSALPVEVLQQAAEEMLDWQGSGMGVMEMSHRGPEYASIHKQALEDLRSLLGVPQTHRILFLQGGALAENAFIPLNLLGTRHVADYVVTGFWSKKTYQEAHRYCAAHLAATTEMSRFTCAADPASWQLSKDPAYVHVCTNETVNGVEYFDLPDYTPEVESRLGAQEESVALVIDASSHILSRPLKITKQGVIYASAQKNFGIAGVTLVIVRDDLLDRALPICPSAFHWKSVAQSDSIYNTPPTYGIYMAGLMFQWLKRQGGLSAIEKRNIEKAQLLYTAIDSSAFYVNKVDPQVRSRMNIPFHLTDESRTEAFLAGAKERRLVQLKGHSSVGGLRASMYNATPMESVQALVSYMQDFERQHA